MITKKATGLLNVFILGANDLNESGAKGILHKMSALQLVGCDPKLLLRSWDCLDLFWDCYFCTISKCDFVCSSLNG